MKELDQDPIKPGNKVRSKGLIIFWILFAVAFTGLVIVKLYFLITTFLD